MSQLMRLMAQCCPLGLALLVFTGLHLFEKHTSMGMEASPLLTSVGTGAAAAATKAQWDTVLFWVMRSTFVGLLLRSKHLLDFIGKVKHDEPLLPVWVIQPPQQQQPFLAQHQQDRGIRKLLVAESPELQQNASGFAVGPAQLDPTSRNFASQTEWPPVGYFPPQSSPTAMGAAAGRSPGFSQAELEKLASN
ncbi:unnamed protein product [Polarella glacialis]|uniref:Uncharacterized protein n=1 Tax=Polarella glacialis TaxID=89957 RepID=A0A813LA75_POLGL|nr:unnamed protein product [Polarella glacialis]